MTMKRDFFVEISAKSERRIVFVDFPFDCSFFVTEFDDAEFASPIALGWSVQRWSKAVHMVPSIAIVAEEQLVVVVGSSADSAALALDALPSVLSYGDDHVVGELEAGWMTGMSADGTSHQRLGIASLLVLVLVA